MSDNYRLFLEHVESHHAPIREVADWDNPHKRYLDRGTVSCDEAEMYEREPIRDAVKKLHRNLFTDGEIDKAIEHCCHLENQSRQREDFLKCVYNYLFKLIS